MKHYTAVLLALAFAFPSTGIAQTAEDIFPAVVFLRGHQGTRTQKIDGQTVELWVRAPDSDEAKPWLREYTGTGFIVLRDEAFFLVTASHVAAAMPRDPTATLLGSDGHPIAYALATLARSEHVSWTVHPHADVAVLPLSPPQTFSALVRAVPFEGIEARLLAPELDTITTTVGFPLKLGAGDRFSPIVKSARPASSLFNYPRFDTEIETTFYILDDPSVAGFSGAPVLRLPRVKTGAISVSQGLFACVGLVHGNFTDPTGGKFAAIVPSTFVAETIELASKR